MRGMKRLWTIVGVRDVPRSFRWYQTLLGLEPGAPEGVAQQPGDSRQRFQVIRTGTFGRQQQEYEIDRLAVERFEIDRALEPGEQAAADQGQHDRRSPQSDRTS